jgi:hypothetical protein
MRIIWLVGPEVHAEVVQSYSRTVSYSNQSDTNIHGSRERRKVTPQSTTSCYDHLKMRRRFAPKRSCFSL